MMAAVWYALGFLCGILFVIGAMVAMLYSMAKTAAKAKPKNPSTIAVMVPPKNPGMN